MEDDDDYVSPKDHEWMRRTGVGSTNYNIAINSPLPSRYVILKNKHNKRQLSQVLSYDTDVFVLLVFWMWTSARMHALTGFDTTSLPFDKSKVSAPCVIEAGDFRGLFHVIGEEGAMQSDLLEAGLSLFCAL